MQLDSLEAFPVRVKMNDRLIGGTFRYEDYQTVLVKVGCGGETGWGEAMTRFSPAATALLVRWVGKQLKDVEFSRPDEAWAKVWRLLRMRGQTRGIAVEALSGVEIAIWDAFARKKKMTLAEALSGNRKTSVPAFAGSVFESRGPIREQVERVKSMGLRGFKMKIGFGASEDVALVRKARGLWDDCLLVPDANGAYDTFTAKKVMAGIARYAPDWMEEPVPSDDFYGYLALAKGRKVPIGAGETWFPGDLENMLGHGAIDVLETSVSRCGGITTQLGTAQRALKFGIGFAPMVGANSSVSVAASLHVASACGSLGIEYDAFENPIVDRLTPGFPVIRNGEMRVPKGHGLGIHIDERFVRSNLSED